MRRLIGLLIIIYLLWPLNLQAAVLKSTYPRLANYFLKWEISSDEARELAKWDLLILDMETQQTSREQILKIRELNPQVIILAYLTPQEILDQADFYKQAFLRQDLTKHLSAAWWLKDAAGQKISNWPGTSLLNLSEGAGFNSQGQRWNDYLPLFVRDKIQASGLWDGIFYDNIWSDISWLNQGDIDLNNDGQAEGQDELKSLWLAGVKKLLNTTRSLLGSDFLIVVNGHSEGEYQKIVNGLMFESFPSPWENGGSWSASMKTYIQLPFINIAPSLPIINISETDPANYRHFRFGLASALLGNGFFSFDYGPSDHGQTWWYDEYDLNLGPAQSAAYSLLKQQTEFSPGLWRRDFKYGSAILNSTNQEQRYIFSQEEMMKLKGTQDPVINNAWRINYLKLAPQDGIILLRINNIIKDSAFTNGYFFRIFNSSGQQVQNGFFSYLKSFPGSEEIIVAANGDEREVSLSAGSGRVNLYKNGERIASFKPYDDLYKKQLNLAAQISEGYFRLLAVGPGIGGGPQVRLFSPTGQLKASFFAYDQKFRGGVNVALGDLEGDGQIEIVSGPGAGLEPLVKVFNAKGELLNSWLAYDQKFRGGVSVALADLDNDGYQEIITGPGTGGGPQVRIFNHQGKAIKSFFAYDQEFHGGIRVSASDLNGDGQIEILVGIRNF